VRSIIHEPNQLELRLRLHFRAGIWPFQLGLGELGELAEVGELGELRAENEW